jgi:hypothetical protein
MCAMSVENLRELIKQELPALIREDQEIQELVLRLAQREFANRAETQDRFYELLNELRKDRAEYRREFDQVHQKFDQVHEEFGRVNKEFDRVHEEFGRVNKEFDRIHEEFGRVNKEFDRVHEEFGRVHEEIMALAKKYDRGIGALGARWGLQSEAAFRNALAGILEESFKVQVLHINEYDDQGIVFGQPDQVELDIIIQNDVLILCEIKSSIDKAGMYTFERKVRFYEQKHGRKATRRLIISPMIEAKAQKVAEKLGIETFSDATEVESL